MRMVKYIVKIDLIKVLFMSKHGLRYACSGSMINAKQFVFYGVSRYNIEKARWRDKHDINF